MKTTLTIPLDAQMKKLLDHVCGDSARKREKLAADALRRRLAVLEFERLQKKVMPYAKAAGYRNEDAILRALS